MKLCSLPEETIERLANEPGVSPSDVRTFLVSIEGLTVDEALVYLDTMSHGRQWTPDTYMACAEGISDAQLQGVNLRRMN